MANSFQYNKETIGIGDTVSISYKIKEGDKERQQLFEGIILKVKGATPETKMITVRKISKSGIGVERIIPLSSPNITSMKLLRHSKYQKAKLYFVRGLSESQMRSKLYREKK